MVTLKFPQQFSKVLSGNLVFAVDGSSLKDALENACKKTPRLRAQLFSETGEISPFLGFQMDGDPRFLTPLDLDQVRFEHEVKVEIILPMAGG